MRNARMPSSTRSPKIERVVTLFSLIPYERLTVDRQHCPPSTSGIVAQLLSQGFVKRGRSMPVGRRISFVTLTPSGLDYLRRLGTPQLRRILVEAGCQGLATYLDTYGFTTYKFELGPLDDAELTLYFLLRRAMHGITTCDSIDTTDKAVLAFHRHERFDDLIAVSPHPKKLHTFRIALTQAGLDHLKAAGGKMLRQVLEKSTDEGLLRLYLSKDLPETPPTPGPWDS